MTEQPRRTGLTADEFIAWVLEQAQGRFELDNGTVVAKAPERVGHGRAKNRTLRALEAAIAERGLACEAHPSVRHYLIVDTGKRVVRHHRRDEEERIGVRSFQNGASRSTRRDSRSRFRECSPAPDRRPAKMS